MDITQTHLYTELMRDNNVIYRPDINLIFYMQDNKIKIFNIKGENIDTIRTNIKDFDSFKQIVMGYRSKQNTNVRPTNFPTYLLKTIIKYINKGVNSLSPKQLQVIEDAIFRIIETSTGIKII